MDSEPRQKDIINILGIVTIGVVGSILVWASVIALQAYFDATAGVEEERREYADQGLGFSNLEKQQEANIKDYRWISADKRVVGLPIERAMRVVAEGASGRSGGSLVPSQGEHDKPTIPVIFGKPADGPATPTGDKPADPTGDTKAADPAGDTKAADPAADKKPADPTADKKPADPTAAKKPADPTAAEKPADPTAAKKPAAAEPAKK